MSTNLGFKFNYPWWFILRDPPDKEIDIEYLITLGINRVDFLKEYSKLKSDLSSKNYYLVNNLIESFFPNIIDQNTNTETLEKYFLGHWFLRICSVFSGRIENWVLETEGDLFETFFNKVSLNDKLEIFQILANSEKKVVFAKLIQHEIYIPNEYVSADNIAVHWSLVPYLVSSKKGALYNGYMVAPFHVFYKSVKKLFEKKLKLNTKELKTNDRFLAFFETNKTIIGAMKNIERNLVNVFKYESSNLIFDDKEMEGVNLFEKLDLFPPCMRFLIHDVKETGYIKHNYRFQLGLFLKRIGMDVDSQLRFWYNLAVDNVGISYDQFVRRAGYIIRHIYGLEGSRTDYEVPSCKKIKTDYFCLFSHINANELRVVLPKMYSVDPEDLEDVINLSNKRLTTESCSKTFEKIYNKKASIYHPLYWIKTSYKVISKNKDEINPKVD